MVGHSVYGSSGLEPQCVSASSRDTARKYLKIGTESNYNQVSILSLVCLSSIICLQTVTIGIKKRKIYQRQRQTRKSAFCPSILFSSPCPVVFTSLLSLILQKTHGKPNSYQIYLSFLQPHYRVHYPSSVSLSSSRFWGLFVHSFFSLFLPCSGVHSPRLFVRCLVCSPTWCVPRHIHKNNHFDLNFQDRLFFCPFFFDC